MAGILKIFSVISLILGTIGSIVMANIGYEFSFITFLVYEVEVFVSFLILFGVGSVWGRQDEIASEHAEIMRMIRGNAPKKEEDIKTLLAGIEARQIQIAEKLNNINNENIGVLQGNTESETTYSETKEKPEELPRAFIVERTYEDIQKRKASQGWKCSKCGTSNPLSRRTCTECGEPR